MDVNSEQRAVGPALVGLGQPSGPPAAADVRTLICDPNCAQGGLPSTRAPRSCSRRPRPAAGERFYTRSSMTYTDPDTGKTRAPATYLRTPPC